MKLILMTFSFVGSNFPFVQSIVSSLGNSSHPNNCQLHGVNPVFFSLSYLQSDWLINNLSNLIVLFSISNVSTVGVDPKHYIGINSGKGLSLIIIMTSSLNFLGSSGIAQTLISLDSSGYNSILSVESINIPGLYSSSY